MPTAAQHPAQEGGKQTTTNLVPPHVLVGTTEDALRMQAQKQMGVESRAARC